jgi:hypothetical protein
MESFAKALVIIVMLLTLGIWLYTDNQGQTHYCEEYGTITDILELQYRSAVIEVNGSIKKTVNQATLKTGDKICLNWERIGT